MAYDTLLVSPETSRAGSPTMYDLVTQQKAGKFRHWVREVLLISAVYKNESTRRLTLLLMPEL